MNEINRYIHYYEYIVKIYIDYLAFLGEHDPSVFRTHIKGRIRFARRFLKRLYRARDMGITKLEELP